MNIKWLVPDWYTIQCTIGQQRLPFGNLGWHPVLIMFRRCFVYNLKKCPQIKAIPLNTCTLYKIVIIIIIYYDH